MKIGIVGCAGRMGRLLVAEVLAGPDCELAGGTERPDSPVLGQDVALLVGGEASGVMVTDDARALFTAADVIVDFTVPAATVFHAGLAAETGVEGLRRFFHRSRWLRRWRGWLPKIVFESNRRVGVRLRLGWGRWRRSLGRISAKRFETALGQLVGGVDRQDLAQAVNALLIGGDHTAHPDPGAFAVRVELDRLRKKLPGEVLLTRPCSGYTLLEKIVM